jgi:hypothetical protein
METNISKAAQGLLNSPEGAELAQRRGDLEKIANSPEGKRVRAMFDDGGDEIMRAFENGDMEKVSGALSGILKTKDGLSLALQLKSLMK